MTDVEAVLDAAETTPAVRHVVEYRRGRSVTPWPSDFVNAVEQTDDLCLQRTTAVGFCTFSYRRGRWWCSEYDRTLDRTRRGRVSQETVLDWVAGQPPELVVCEEALGTSVSDSATESVSSPVGESSVGSDSDPSVERRQNADGEPDFVALRVELESVVGAMTRIDWSVVPDVSALEAASWSARLAAARDSLASDREFVTAETLDATPTKWCLFADNYPLFFYSVGRTGFP